MKNNSGIDDRDDFLEFDIIVDIPLSQQQLDLATKKTCLYYLGDEIPNRKDRKTGKFVSKYPNKETPEFKDAIFRLNSGKRRTLTCVIDIKTGHLQIKQIQK